MIAYCGGKILEAGPNGVGASGYGFNGRCHQLRNTCVKCGLHGCTNHDCTNCCGSVCPSCYGQMIQG